MKASVKGIVTALGVSETFGVGSGSFGTTIYDGLRIEVDGVVTWIPRLVCSGHTASLLEGAMDSGQEVELWLSGPPDTKLAYAVRAGAERHYDTAGIPFEVFLVGLRYAVFGLLTLYFVIGFPVLLYGFYQFYRAHLFRPSHRPEVFETRVEAPAPTGIALAVVP